MGLLLVFESIWAQEFPICFAPRFLKTTKKTASGSGALAVFCWWFGLVRFLKANLSGSNVQGLAECAQGGLLHGFAQRGVGVDGVGHVLQVCAHL